MLGRQILRFFYSNNCVRSPINKSDLAKLRKKTGYTFANCKKALETNDNDVVLAEKWLKEQAQAFGWSKATKLQGRSTLQGLIGVITKGNAALMLEVNCETDFVARNKKFHSLVELAVQTCAAHCQALGVESDNLSKVMLDKSQLGSIASIDGKSLGDHAALAISNLGENLNLRRAVYVKTSGDIRLAGFTHPSAKSPGSTTLTGKYGAVVAYRASADDAHIQQTAKQICQHIVGMNPVKVGTIGTDEPVEDKDEEAVMIHQDFLLDPTVTVGQLLTDMGIEIVDFVRFECGEPADEDTEPVEAFNQS